jgi:hypothetical protein
MQELVTEDEIKEVNFVPIVKPFHENKIQIYLKSYRKRLKYGEAVSELNLANGCIPFRCHKNFLS